MLRSALIAASLLMGVALLLFGIWDAKGRSSLLSGLTDPLYGLDHFLALLAVGIWAGRLRGANTWKLPAVFLGGTVPGFLLMVGQPPIPLTDALVHIVIVGSILSFVAAFLIPIRIPTSEAVTTVAMIGGCHGSVHASEVGATAAAGWFGVGALLTASGLTAAGVAVGLATPRVT